MITIDVPPECMPMNPGEVRFLGGRLASTPSRATIRIEPRVAVENLKPGTLIRLGFSNGDHERSAIRPGYGAIRAIDTSTGELTFDLPINTIVPAAAEGDSVWEYEPPCSRCECRRCQRERGAP